MYQAYKNNGDTKERGGTKIIPNHALDTIGNPSDACLPPFRPSLTSYALEYSGALRMIRVFVFSNDLMTWVMPRGWQELIYIGRSIQREPLDQTDLKNGVDWISMAVENRHSKRRLIGVSHGSAILQVGPASPTCQPLRVYFNGLPSGVF